MAASTHSVFWSFTRSAVKMMPRALSCLMVAYSDEFWSHEFPQARFDARTRNYFSLPSYQSDLYFLLDLALRYLRIAKPKMMRNYRFQTQAQRCVLFAPRQFDFIYILLSVNVAFRRDSANLWCFWCLLMDWEVHWKSVVTSFSSMLKSAFGRSFLQSSLSDKRYLTS